MRKILLTATLLTTAISLAACSGTESSTDASAEDATADTAINAEVMADSAATDTTGVLDANTATADQLSGIEGISAELGQAIVTGKPYANIVELNAKLLETLSQDEAATVLINVFVPVNLNSASRQEIDLIPGMTDRMAHEFEEYRPYENMDEFDREIGKYVDEAEVARFRNYVTL